MVILSPHWQLLRHTVGPEPTTACMHRFLLVRPTADHSLCQQPHSPGHHCRGHPSRSSLCPRWREEADLPHLPRSTPRDVLWGQARHQHCSAHSMVWSPGPAVTGQTTPSAVPSAEVGITAPSTLGSHPSHQDKPRKTPSTAHDRQGHPSKP